MTRAIQLLSLFTIIATTVGAIPSARSNDRPLLRREDIVDISDQSVPYFDYDGIAAAAEVAVEEDLQRRGLGDGPSIEKRNNVPTCHKVNVRKEWRKLTTSEKKAYIKGVKCLAQKPDFGVSPISSTLYDAFVYIHQNNWFAFHACAPFAPWHRWFVWLREVTMREACGYDGPFPYWNFTMDYQNVFAAPLFSADPEIGFGTQGTEVYSPMTNVTGFKVSDGSFANLKVAIPQEHYLTRNFSAWKDIDPQRKNGTALGNYVSPDYLRKTLAANSFWDFEIILDGLYEFKSLGIHNTMHFNQAGDWTGPNWLINNSEFFPFASTAPNDPMFFPHHAYVDAVFWQWQQQRGKQYLYGGSTNLGNLTLNDAKVTDKLPFSGFGPNPPVALALKTESYPLCYTYDH